SVYDNMAFGLKLRKFKKEEIKNRVNNAANILGIKELLDRKPKLLSGGQRQRVALGRAIVRDAKEFLMDEPLSNLDAKLRVQMRTEIQKLHQRLKTTTVYGTHDQIEAMTMATKLVVMKDGVIQQVGPPKTVYALPENTFVGGFIGSPPMNFIKGYLEENYFIWGDSKVAIPEGKMETLRKLKDVGEEIILGVRPEDIHDEPLFINSSPDTKFNALIDVAELMGAEIYLYLEKDKQFFTASIDARAKVDSGDKLELALDMNKTHFFDIQTEKRIKEVKEE